MLRVLPERIHEKQCIRHPRKGENKMDCKKLLIPAMLVLSTPLWAQGSAGTHGRSAAPKDPPADSNKATLLVRTDMACSWRLDGEDKGKLDTEARVRVQVDMGERLIEAVATDGGYKWEKTVKVSEPQSMVVTIELRTAQDEAERAKRQAEDRAEDAKLTWTDPATGLMWTKHDNGSDVTWQQAANYCRNLTLGNHYDWHLPEVNELGAVYDQTQSGRGYGTCSTCTFHVRGILQLSGWEWSNTAGAFGEAWSFDIHGGRRYSGQLDISHNARVLCVRRSGE
jgi:hypothetical protein